MTAAVWKHDLAWAACLVVVGLTLGLLVHGQVIREGLDGTLELRLADVEREEAARRLAAITTYPLEKVLALHQEGKTLFIDAREPDEFRELHIERAVNLPATQLTKALVAAKLQQLPMDHPIVVYCGSADCHASLRVAEFLQKQGYTRVAVYVGGFRAWDEAGYPVDIVR